MEQSADVAIERGRQSGERGAQPGLGFMAIGLGSREQARDLGGTTPGRFRAREDPVLAPERDRPDRILDPVVVDLVMPVIEVARQCAPTLEAVVDGFGQTAAGEAGGSQAHQPAMEIIEPGLGMQPSVMFSRFRIQVLYRRFNPIQIYNLMERLGGRCAFDWPRADQRTCVAQGPCSPVR